MTVSSETSRVEYAGNGTTTAFTVPYYFLANGDLLVYQSGTLKTITTHYSVSGAGSLSGGTVTFVTAPASGEDVVILRDPAITQSTDYTPNDPFPAESHERALDRLTMIAQRTRDLGDRSLRLDDGEAGSADMTLPDSTDRASRLLGFTSGGEPTVSTNTLAQFDAAVSSFVNATGNNAASIIFDPSGTGAVTTTVQAKLREVVSVKDFGAVGDGTTDDTAAIQAAIDSLSGGGTVKFLPATYLCDSSDIDLASNVNLEGDNTIIKQGAGVTALLVGTNISNFRISGLKLQGNSTESGGTSYVDNGIYLNGCSDFSITDCEIYEFAHFGIRVANSSTFEISGNYFHGQLADADNADINVTQYVTGSATCQNFIIKGNRCLSGNGAGILLGSQATDFTVSDNICNNHLKHGICFYQPGIETHGTITGNFCADNEWNGIYLNGQATTHLMAVSVAGNTCVRNGGSGGAYYQFNAGISVYEVYGASVTGNVIRDNTNAGDPSCGISVFYDCQGVAVSGNTINETSGHGIHLSHSLTHCSIVGNTVTDAGLTGIKATYGAANPLRQSVISSNTIKSSGEHGIFLEAFSGTVASEVTISGNAVSLSQKHGIYLSYVSYSSLLGNSTLDNSQSNTSTGSYDGIGGSNVNNVALIGNVSRNTTPASGQRYGIYLSSSTYLTMQGNQLIGNRTGATTNNPVEGVYAQKGGTANRPAFNAGEGIGSLYFDTTLDADGMPIMWNGSKWIKFDGSDA